MCQHVDLHIDRDSKNEHFAVTIKTECVEEPIVLEYSLEGTPVENMAIAMMIDNLLRDAIRVKGSMN